MPTLTFTLDYPLNVSVQPGDTLYFSNTNNNQGGNNSIIEIGEILSVAAPPVVPLVLGTLGACCSPVPAGGCAVGCANSTITLNTINLGVIEDMIVSCHGTGTPLTQAQQTLLYPDGPIPVSGVLPTPAPTVTNLSSATGNTVITITPAAFDLLGGTNYTWTFTYPGVVQLVVNMPLVQHQLYGNDIDENSFLLFSKNSKANMSSMLGYYSDVLFRNNSKKKVELFSVGTEVIHSSK